jgi:hypothetical protein
MKWSYKLQVVSTTKYGNGHTNLKKSKITYEFGHTNLKKVYSSMNLVI